MRKPPRKFTGARSARARPLAGRDVGGRRAGGIASESPSASACVVLWMPVGSRQFHIGRAFSQA